MEIEVLDIEFSVCKVESFGELGEFFFAARTDEENSLVCPTACVPENTSAREDGWGAFRICGTLDFSLVGILAKIASLLAENGVSIFAVSTYNTDYVLTKDIEKAVSVLAENGYVIK